MSRGGLSVSVGSITGVLGRTGVMGRVGSSLKSGPKGLAGLSPGLTTSKRPSGSMYILYTSNASTASSLDGNVSIDSSTMLPKSRKEEELSSSDILLRSSGVTFKLRMIIV